MSDEIHTVSTSVRVGNSVLSIGGGSKLKVGGQCGGLDAVPPVESRGTVPVGGRIGFQQQAIFFFEAKCCFLITLWHA